MFTCCDTEVSVIGKCTVSIFYVRRWHWFNGFIVIAVCNVYVVVDRLLIEIPSSSSRPGTRVNPADSARQRSSRSGTGRHHLRLPSSVRLTFCCTCFTITPVSLYWICVNISRRWRLARVYLVCEAKSPYNILVKWFVYCWCKHLNLFNCVNNVISIISVVSLYCRGTAAAAPPPFKPSKPGLCGSCPLVIPY